MNELAKNHKSKMIGIWKSRGLIDDDIDTLYQYYIETLNCEWCGIVFENTRDRNLDHCHETGKFRLVVCNKCNSWDSYLKYPDGYDKTKWRKKYYSKYYIILNINN